MIRRNVNTVLTAIAHEAAISGRANEDIFLVVISKGKSIEHVLEAYDAGVKDFGENRVVEALEKMGQAPKDIRWHFVGKLQRNKVSQVIGKFALIHSVDSYDLAKKISELSLKEGIQTSILLQANTSNELSKGGLNGDQWKGHIANVCTLKGISIQGLMTMAPLTEDETIIRKCFRDLRRLRDDLEQMSGLALPTLSMGMSNDFRIAIQEGATILRIGSLIFLPQ